MKAGPLVDVTAIQRVVGGYFYHRDTHTHTGGDPGRWDYSRANTDAAHAQVQTKAIKRTHHLTRTHAPQSNACMR